MSAEEPRRHYNVTFAVLAGAGVSYAIPQRRPEEAFAPHPVGDLEAARS